METIRNYLESMFANLPNTPEVMRAKNELLSMMEDKFTELISEGKPQNEAVGIVISEFGNLEELAESLGIDKVVGEKNVCERRLVTNEEARNYIYDAAQNRTLIGLGVMLIIFAPIFPIIFNEIGAAFLFIDVSIGVGLIVWACIRMSQWKFLDNTLCCIDFSTAEYLYTAKKNNMTSKAIMLTVGIMFCIVSVIPVIIFEGLFSAKDYYYVIVGPAMLFIIVGIGVLLIIASGAKDSAYTKLLSLNGTGTIAGNYEAVRATKEPYTDKKKAAEVMSVYWRTVTCIYIIWSFISFDWHITWIIWPLAAVFNGIMKTLFNTKW
ncbi:MAG: permease prefix domain 1-containing protein [Butyrivibrio sp.]|nr:permease prefix domain 1-containing protein [Butyrivibrio sp.]